MMDFASLMRSYSRYILIIFNFIFSLTGIVIISVGISAKAYFHEFETLLDQKYFYVSDVLILIGVIIFFIAFFGCCGAMKENACMTQTYSSLLIIIFLLELVVGIAGFLLQNRTENFITNELEKTLSLYGKKNSTEYTEVWDNVQRQFKCCGVRNATDWIVPNSTNHGLPLSCCPLPSGQISNFTCSIDHKTYYDEGCLDQFVDYIKNNISVIEGVSIGLAVIQLLGIMFSCYLAKSIRSDYETV